MRIGLDARPLGSSQLSGIPTYLRGILVELAKQDKENNYILYSHRDFDYDLPSPRWQKKAGSVLGWGTPWLQMELPRQLKKDDIDVFWGVQHAVPLFASKRCKTVLTVHDLVHLFFPDTMEPMNWIISKLLVSASVKRSDVTICISESTKRDLLRTMPVENKAIEVVPNGVSDFYRQTARAAAVSAVHQKFSLHKPYFLTVGTFEPRKNLRAVLDAFALAAGELPHDLILVGQKGWKMNDLNRRIESHPFSNRIRRMGYVPLDDMPHIYAAADAFIFPSFYEGFGLPPLEAMASGVPTIVSNTSSLPEVVGDAGLLIDPRQPDEIAAAMKRIHFEPGLREKLQQKGLEQSRKFSWAQTAHQLLAIFNQFRPT